MLNCGVHVARTRHQMSLTRPPRNSATEAIITQLVARSCSWIIATLSGLASGSGNANAAAQMEAAMKISRAISIAMADDLVGDSTVRPNVRGEAGPTARQASRWKDDKHNLEPAGLPCRWASPRPRD
jgi:hypothetical protein